MNVYHLTGINYFGIETPGFYLIQNCIEPYIFIEVNEQYRSYSFWLGDYE